MCRMAAIIALLIFVCAGVGQAELALRPVSRDETVEYTLNRRFSLDTALTCLESIKDALKSFRKLTEEVEGKVTRKRLKEIGNTDWDFQNLGFRNWPGVLEGTLRKQEYLIRKLQYDLLRERAAKEKTGDRELFEAKRAFEEAERDFQVFWNEFGVSD